MKYGILGSGPANARVVQDGLLDLIAKDSDAEFVIHARRAPQGAVGDVYDFLVDNHSRYTAATRVDDKAPKVLLDGAVETVTVDDPAQYIIDHSDEILLLWDEGNEEASNKFALMADAKGRPVKDLTMALTPIVFGDDEVPPAPSQDEPAEITPFTRDELADMAPGVLKRQAKAMGIDTTDATKEQLIDSILNEDTPEVASDVHVPKPPQAVVVYWEDGSYRTVQVPLEEIKKLLG